MENKLLIDVCAGLGGWQRPFAENGWRTVGVDIREQRKHHIRVGVGQ